MPFYEEQFKNRKLSDDNFAWIAGQYVQIAVASCLSKEAQYPKKPSIYKFYDEEEVDEDGEPVTTGFSEFEKLAIYFMDFNDAHFPKKEE